VSAENYFIPFIQWRIARKQWVASYRPSWLFYIRPLVMNSIGFGVRAY
jgi:hypothetical protein